MSPIEIFFVYSRQDEALRNALEKHLSPLKRHGYISTWHDRRIGASQEWVREIDNHLDTAQVILLLVSPDFLASDYCYSIEMKRAVERHESGEARVIPIILRHCYWQEAPFSKLQALPKDAKPVRSWSDLDEAFSDVTEGIRKAVIELRKKFLMMPTVAVEQSGVSSNLIPAVGESTVQTAQAIDTATIVPNKLTSNLVTNLPGILNGNIVENRSVRGVPPEHKTEISGLRSRVLTGHSKLVRSVAISLDGRTIVSGSGDRTVRIWDLQTGMLQRTLAGHTGEIWGVAISMSGKTIVSGGGDKTVRIWDLQTGKPSHILNGHRSWIRSVAISADEETIISSGTDKAVRVWDLQTGGLLRTFGDYGNAVNSVAISEDGRMIVSDSEYIVKIWNLDTGMQHSLTGHSNWVMSVTISLDGRTIVSGSADGTVKIWDLRSGDLLHTLTGHEDRVNSVAISNNGKIVSGSGDKTVRIWDMYKGELLHVLRGHEDRVMCVAIGRDGRTVVSGGHDESVRIWNLDAEGTKDIAQ